MKHFFKLVRGPNKCLNCIDLHMVLECDLSRRWRSQLPWSCLYICLSVRLSTLGSVLTQNLSWTKEPWSEWANWHHENIECLSAPLSGSFQHFLRWVLFFLKIIIQCSYWTGNKGIYLPYFKILTIFILKANSKIIVMVIMIVMMRMVIVMIKIIFCLSYTIF